MQLLTETVFTPRWVSQVFEVGGDRNQIRLNLQVHLSVQVGLDYLMKTHTNATLHPTNWQFNSSELQQVDRRRTWELSLQDD